MKTSRTILIADDQQIDRTALRDILRAEPSWGVVEAPDGQQAMDMLCQGRMPDVCLLDLNMPRVSGLEALQRIRRDPLLRDLKVVITSGSRDKDMIVTLARLKISGYVLKPYDSGKIMAALKPLLDAGPADPSLFAKNLLGKTVLVVDDSATDRAALREIFKAEAGWEIVMAQDGVEAMDKLTDGLRPDLVLVDLRMPRMDGHDLIRRIRDDPALRTLRVAVISAEHDREKVKALATSGISGYLLKPFEVPKVRAVIQQAAGVLAAKTEGAAV